jgi:hypothetical protein
VEETMKNVEEVFLTRPVFKVRMQDAPPAKGWTLRYISGAEERRGIEPGNLLIQWFVDRTGTVFNFGPELDQMVVFDTEAKATGISEWIKQNTDVKSEVIKVG